MKYLLLPIALLIFNLSHAQQEAKRLDSLFTAEYSAGNFNGNVLVADKGKVVFQKSFGLRNEETKEMLDENSVFELASVSKQFTAMGIVILQEKGKLKYEDKLSKFFPELSFYGDVTVRQLLNHTGGLPDYMDLFSADWDRTKMATNKDIIAQFADRKPAAVFAPGTKYEYSNTGYALLGSIIEKVSGMTFGDYLAKNIFKPLKMDNTFVYMRRYQPREVKNYAYGYVYSNAERKKLLPDGMMNYNMVVWLDGIVGDGMVNSTTGDLLKWDRALKENKLVSKKSMDLIFTPGDLADGTKTNYGFGWMFSDSPEFGKIISHTGGWPGYVTRIDRYADSDKTLIVLQNSDESRFPIGAVRNIMFGKPVTGTPRKEIAVAEDKLKQYIGGYEIVPGYVMQVTYENGLFTQMPGQDKFPVFAESETKFFLKVVDAQLEFFKDEKGTVTKAMLYQNGQSVSAARVK
ncbi:MAG: serine hydrolase [Flavobacterium sp.]|nr:MAG: serine hydrolase [Flavobacterium sp.]